jgi:hypothetical protein
MSKLITNTSKTVICFVNDSLNTQGIRASKENNVYFLEIFPNRL